MAVTPYLFFDGRCEEAIEFYRKAVGAEVGMLMRYKDSPEPAMCAPGSENKVMHASLQLGGSPIMMSDGHCTGNPSFKGFGVSLTAKDVGESERLFGGLSEGGQVQMPLTKTFFSPSFGMVTDKFGVMWMVMVEP